MPRPLVIVESPAKAKTIAGFLGPDYAVESSIGHIRDLPRSAAEVPASLKGEPWARLGVDVDNDFKALYIVAKEKREQVAKLKRLTADASELYLATDEDREGESIAWHLVEVLSPRVPVHRMVFHEITAAAIATAVREPRELDRRLVDAQEARRILDRLYGYEVSPVLWRKVAPRLSAGRVQSVATRMVVERERERMRFRSGQWWSLEGDFEADAQAFSARLADLAGKAIATGDDFLPTGLLSSPGAVTLLDEPGARALVDVLSGSDFHVAKVEERPYRRSPAAPFITSTLQQEAARKLRYSAQRTMRLAQALYERGYITYMRTDSTTLSQTAIAAARRQATSLYGPGSVPERPRTYRKKVKNAQEAHEAIRPAGDSFRTPSSVSGQLSSDERRLYELVWQRTVASQMIDATGTSARVRLEALTSGDCPVAPGGSVAGFLATGTVITSPGFLQVYREDDDDEEAGDGRRGRRTESSSASGPAGAPAGSGAPAEDNVRLPRLEEGAGLSCTNILSEEHATKAPARFTEASLIRRLEELGIGRPSTYAGIIQTIQDRGYVWRKGTALVPSFTAFAVVGLMERHFPNLVDYGFTASMEDDLDQIASGSEELVPWLERFYFGETRHLELEQRAGDGHEVDRSGPARGDAGPARGARDQPHHVLAVDGRRGLKDAVLAHLEEIDAREVNSIPIGADPNGEEIVVRVGRYGPYLQRGEERASVPDDVAPDELTVERALVLLESPNGDRALGTDPASGLNVLARAGRFGPYVQLGDAQSGSGKPATASLFGTMSIETVTLSQALQLLTLPRVVGADPESGAEVVAANGRYGPYLKRGEETRSLENEEQLFEVGIEEALRLFAEPKRRRFGASGGPLRELGADPVSGQPVLVRDGRFGPYVTDGSVNASLRRGDDPAEITLERAGELLQARREAGASTPRARAGRGSRVKKASTATKAAPTRKVGAKKAPTKKVGAKKAPTKKTGTRAEAAGTKKVASRAGGAKKAPAKDSSPKSG